MEAARRADRLRISDSALARERDRLFQTDLFIPPVYLVHRIIRSHGDAGLTVLVSRLLAPTPPENQLAARQQDQRMKLAILRELRFLARPALADVYALVLAEEDSVEVVEFTLLDGLRLDPDRFAMHALRLAVPGARNAHAGARHLRLRRFALRVLVAQVGAGHPDAISALRHAVTDDRLSMALTAVNALRPGEQPGISAAALARVLPQVLRGDRGLEWSLFLATLSRVQLPSGHPLVAQLVEAAGQRQDLAYAILGALRAGRLRLAVEQREQLQILLRKLEDVGLQQALDETLLVIDPGAELQGSADSLRPWVDLRRRLDEIFTPH
ncbi:MAG: hypothetical protein EA402_10830 [Planctomycetota bacterium]|nr:MAG: hypothetical protein EA402_10830 [Planctomycetota bacterium]